MPYLAKSNEQLVKEIMQHPEHGVVAEAFIIEAIRYYSEGVVKSKPNSKSSADSFISQELWISIAEDALERLKENYEQ